VWGEPPSLPASCTSPTSSISKAWHATPSLFLGLWLGWCSPLSSSRGPSLASPTTSVSLLLPVPIALCQHRSFVGRHLAGTWYPEALAWRKVGVSQPQGQGTEFFLWCRQAGGQTAGGHSSQLYPPALEVACGLLAQVFDTLLALTPQPLLLRILGTCYTTGLPPAPLLSFDLIRCTV
jgi:hypothetical protein